MDKEKAHRALVKTAQMNHTSVESVIQEIDEAIALAIATADPAAREFWRKIPHSGERPSAEEVVAYLGEVLGR